MIDREYLKRFMQAGDIRYALYPSPAGDLYLLADGSLLKAVIFKRACGARNVERHFRRGTSPAIAGCRALLDDYFRLLSHRHKTVKSSRVSLKTDVLLLQTGNTRFGLDLAPFTEKEITVYRALMDVPFGETITYGALAGLAGIPGGARFVGNAMAKNNFPIIIPCHRVILSDGSIGNYSSGTDIKEYLLAREGTRRSLPPFV